MKVQVRFVTKLQNSFNLKILKKNRGTEEHRKLGTLEQRNKRAEEKGKKREREEQRNGKTEERGKGEA